VSATNLFVGKAEQYARYRTDYPGEVIQAALAAIHLARGDVVADLGSGTGMLARWILERGHKVFGVEPDAGMRAVAENWLAAFGREFASVAGSAEATTLPPSSVDVIVAGNAFHYFDPVLTRVEAGRILRSPGRALIVGHAAALAPNAFMRAYGDFLESIASAPAWTFHEPGRDQASLRTFFAPGTFQHADAGQLSHPFSWELLSGRFLSTSLAPAEGDARRPQVLAQLKDLFDRFARDGMVEFQLRWRYAWGTLGPGAPPAPQGQAVQAGADAVGGAKDGRSGAAGDGRGLPRGFHPHAPRVLPRS
jgi:SAM-dependent methyltransferase